jgi:plastocyanin
MPVRALPIALAAALAALVLAATGGAAAKPTLVGTVGPGFTIKVTMNGKPVKTLTAGAYTLVVHDKANIHNFHLLGPGANKVVTTVPFVGVKTVAVTLKKGTYTFQCDPHAAGGMKGTFTVT